ncbi:DUF1176 domain-containing protein [Sphingobium nicotianae]|nr:DUF1176 domain-containing protein [Sphingobium nicotianae]
MGGLALLWVSCASFGAQPVSSDAPPLPELGKPAPAAEPLLGRIQVFGDWAVGCDNRLTCSAVSLIPDGAGTSYSVLVSIQRAGGPEGASTLRLIGADQLAGKIDLFVDNRALTRATAAHDMIEMSGAPAIDFIRTLGSSYTFELREKKQTLDAPSLRGLPQALRYIDEQQGRVGSKGALAALGDGPADLAKPIPPGPTVTPDVAPVADSGPLDLTPEEQAAARKLAVCEAHFDNEHPFETHILDTDHALVLLPCNAGDYNVSAVPLVATGGAGKWQFQIARFDHVPGSTGDPGTPPLIVNARWNPVRGELSSFAKGRGLGDCGTAETYKWDGATFRLTEARSMPVCRGAWEWPVLYSVAQG